MKKTIILGLAILIPIVIIGAALWLFWKVSHPPLALGKNIYTRQIYILIDITYSMEEIAPFLEEAKELVKKHIFPVVNPQYMDFYPVGPGDQIFCYTINPLTFDEYSNLVFESNLPPIPQNVLEWLKQEKKLPEEWKKDLSDRWEEVRNAIEDYREKVSNLQIIKGGFSAYLEAIEYISTRLRYLQIQNDMKEKFVIVIGDMEQWKPSDFYYQDPESKSFKYLPTPIPEDQRIFHRVKVWLVYPAGVIQLQNRASLVHGFWKQYFIQRGCKEKDIHIVPFGGFSDIPYNQVPLSYKKNE